MRKCEMTIAVCGQLPARGRGGARSCPQRPSPTAGFYSGRSPFARGRPWRGRTPTTTERPGCPEALRAAASRRSRRNGGSGIRTHGWGIPIGSFQDCCLKPLGHPSPGARRKIPGTQPENYAFASRPVNLPRRPGRAPPRPRRPATRPAPGVSHRAYPLHDRRGIPSRAKTLAQAAR